MQPPSGPQARADVEERCALLHDRGPSKFLRQTAPQLELTGSAGLVVSQRLADAADGLREGPGRPSAARRPGRAEPLHGGGSSLPNLLGVNTDFCFLGSVLLCGLCRSYVCLGARRDGDARARARATRTRRRRGHTQHTGRRAQPNARREGHVTRQNKSRTTRRESVRVGAREGKVWASRSVQLVQSAEHEAH